MLKCPSVSVSHLPDNRDQDNLRKKVGIPFRIAAFVSVGSLEYPMAVKDLSLGQSARLLIFRFPQFLSAVSTGIPGICWTRNFLVLDGKIFESDCPHTHTHTHSHARTRTHPHTHTHTHTHTVCRVLDCTTAELGWGK